MIGDMKVLLIGGTGVLSSAVAKEALKKGIHVTMINRGRRLSVLPENVSLIKADKNDTAFIEKQLIGKKFDAIIDFLCYSKVEVARSFNLYSQFTNQYFFISSCAVYNPSADSICTEDAPKVRKVWQYSVHKFECEQLLVRLAEQKGVNYTIVRPSVTYDNTRIPYGISPRYGYHWTLAARIIAGKPIIKWNDGNNYCNMLRVEDFAVGLIGLVGNPLALNEAFNICGDEAPTYNDVLDVMSEYLGLPVKTVDLSPETYAAEIPARAGELLGGRSVSSYAANEKIKHAVPEFKQTISIREGIKMTLDAYKTQAYQRGIDWKFDGETDRIIHKYFKRNPSIRKRDTSFADYLGNARFADKINYLTARYKSRFLNDIGVRLKRMATRILKKVNN